MSVYWLSVCVSDPGSTSLLVIEILGSQLVARKPYLMQTLDCSVLLLFITNSIYLLYSGYNLQGTIFANHQIYHLPVIFAIIKFANHCMYRISFCMANQFTRQLLLLVLAVILYIAVTRAMELWILSQLNCSLQDSYHICREV